MKATSNSPRLIRDLRHGTEPEKAQEQLKNHLLTLDREMANRDYIVGNDSLGDLTFIPFFLRQQRYGTSIGADTPHLKAWMDRLPPGLLYAQLPDPESP